MTPCDLIFSYKTLHLNQSRLIMEIENGLVSCFSGAGKSPLI